jgi:asparagine synthase (glutamine-hydrolysing)
MSFIYGIINLDQKAVTSQEIEALATAVKWEGFQEHATIANNYALGYCHHPERKPNAGIFEYENLIILADIRIYNTPELQNHFSFASPEEAFAKGYQKWGIDCANYINGDFAVVVFDKIKNEIHLFRDHIGARPLTYWFENNQLIFASHEFGLAQSKLVKTALSEEKLIIDFFQQKRNYSQTTFENTYKIIPGHSVRFSSNGKQQTKYWKPEQLKKNKTLSFDQAVSQLRKLLLEATTNRIESGKTGVHVSGGLDSTGVAAILADTIEDKSQLIGYSWTPETFQEEFEGVDEKVLIETFASEKKVTINYLRLNENELSKDLILPEFERMSIEHPTMKMAAKDHVSTIFSGWGGDEFVSLSTRGIYNHLFFSFKWKMLRRFILKNGIKRSIMRFRTEVLPLVIPLGLLPVYRSKDWSILRYTQFHFIRKHWKKIILNRSKNIFGYGNRTQFMLNLLHNYHIPDRMDSWSLHSERYGFVYKYPLLDKAVLEFWFSMPIEYTYCNMQSRLLYRETMKGILTECIRVRRDKGEGMRISYTKQKQKEENLFLQNLFLILNKNEQLPFFKNDLIKNFIQKEKVNPTDKKAFSIPLYLRYVALTKKYLS